eukprot:COSAG02_NODE_495_length_21151_cov_31.954256_21_plen_46_part_00
MCPHSHGWLFDQVEIVPNDARDVCIFRWFILVCERLASIEQQSTV